MENLKRYGPCLNKNGFATIMDSDLHTVKIGAITGYLDYCGVTGNLYGKALKLITILDGLEEKFTSTNKQSTQLVCCCCGGKIYQDEDVRCNTCYSTKQC